MKYVERVLQPGETVQYRSTIHWIVYLHSLLFFIVGAAGIVVLVSANQLKIPLPVLALFIGVGSIGGIFCFLPAWLKRRSTELAVTNRRVIFKRGFIRRHTIEMNMDKVESVDVDQSFWGRIFNYGTIVVHGTGGSLEPLPRIDSPIEFRNQVTAH